jgi:hypothetical protein
MSLPTSIKDLVAQDPQIVACPKCNAQFRFFRSSAARFDDCGFESYRLECIRCTTPLIGIIDPADNKLLLSEQDTKPDLQSQNSAT